MIAKTRTFKLGLGTCLALVIAALIIALTGVIVKIAGVRVSGEIKASIGHDLEELAFQTTDTLDRGMFERYREVQLMADRSFLADRAIGADEKRKAITRMQETYPSYAWIGVTDPQGTVLVATGKHLEGVDVSKRPWFSDAIGHIHLHDVHEAALLAKLLPNPDNEPKRFFDVAFPYFHPNGTLAGVLGTHLSWQWAAEVQRSVFGPVARRSHVEPMIVAKDGTVLLGPEAQMGKKLSPLSFKAAQTSGTGYLTEHWDDGKEYLVGYSKSTGYRHYPGLGWTVLVRQELNDAYRPVYALQRAVLLAGVLAAILFSLLGFVLARRITRPVAAIAREAGLIESGQASTITVNNSGVKEIATLSGALHSLLDKLAAKEASLRQLNATLEERVQTRTDELARALDDLALDNAERRKAERALRMSEQRLATVTDSIPVAILYIDKDERFRFVNRTYLTWFRQSAQTLLGLTLGEVYGEAGPSGARYSEIKAFVQRALLGEMVVFEAQRMIAGEQRHVELTCLPDKDVNGNVMGFYAMLLDITDRKNLQLHFEHDATHDALTGLPNRKALRERLDEALARAARSGKPLAVMFLDLNKFKQINDTYGHAAGDEVLIFFASTLRACVRKTDTVARLSGDEFVVVTEELASGEHDAILIADKIIDTLRVHEGVGEAKIRLATSIGIAVLREARGNADDLLARADAAMYGAKQDGGGWKLG